MADDNTVIKKFKVYKSTPADSKVYNLGSMAENVTYERNVTGGSTLKNVKQALDYLYTNGSSSGGGDDSGGGSEGGGSASETGVYTSDNGLVTITENQVIINTDDDDYSSTAFTGGEYRVKITKKGETEPIDNSIEGSLYTFSSPLNEGDQIKVYYKKNTVQITIIEKTYSQISNFVQRYVKQEITAQLKNSIKMGSYFFADNYTDVNPIFCKVTVTPSKGISWSSSLLNVSKTGFINGIKSANYKFKNNNSPYTYNYQNSSPAELINLDHPQYNRNTFESFTITLEDGYYIKGIDSLDTEKNEIFVLPKDKTITLDVDNTGIQIEAPTGTEDAIYKFNFKCSYTNDSGNTRILKNITTIGKKLTATHTDADNNVIQGDEEEKNIITNNFIDLIYPVGSIYMSVNSTSPAILFGGRWESINGRFLLSSGYLSEGYESYTAGTTGGLEAAVLLNHSHYINNAADKLGSNEKTPITINTTTNAATHKHTLENFDKSDKKILKTDSSGATRYGVAVSNFTTNAADAKHNHSISMYINASSESPDGIKYSRQNNANLPPYLVVNMWQRIK